MKKLNLVYFVIIILLLMAGGYFAYYASFSFQPVEIGEGVNPDDLTMDNQPWVNSMLSLKLDEIANYRTYPIIMLWLILIGICVIIYQNSKTK